MTVTEYEMEFNGLAEHELILVLAETKIVKRFVDSLNPYTTRDMASYVDDKNFYK